MHIEPMQATQWVYNMLLKGFQVPLEAGRNEKFRSFRQENLKHMVLNSLFEEYRRPVRRAMSGNTPYI